MGKSLIIKGADFSENGIATLIGWVGGYTSEGLSWSSVISGDSVYVVAPSEVTRLNMVGKTIKYIKINAAATGYIKVYTANTSTQPPYSVSNEQTIAVPQTGVVVLELPTPITITNSNSIALYGKGIVHFRSAAADYPAYGWRYFVANTSTELSPARISADWGYNL